MGRSSNGPTLAPTDVDRTSQGVLVVVPVGGGLLRWRNGLNDEEQARWTHDSCGISGLLDGVNRRFWVGSTRPKVGLRQVTLVGENGGRKWKVR